jgi:hypothetical protein
MEIQGKSCNQCQNSEYNVKKYIHSYFYGWDYIDRGILDSNKNKEQNQNKRKIQS